MNEIDGRITFRPSPGLRESLEAEADRNRRSLSGQIIFALEEWLAGRGRPPVPSSP